MRKLFAMLAVAAFAMAACGGGDGGGEDGCADLTGSASFTITLTDNAFDPTCATAERSQALTLQNDGSARHTFTIDGTQVDVEVAGGETANLEAINDALDAGTYTAYCRFHGHPDGTGMAMELTAT